MTTGNKKEDVMQPKRGIINTANVLIFMQQALQICI